VIRHHALRTTNQNGAIVAKRKKQSKIRRKMMNSDDRLKQVKREGNKPVLLAPFGVKVKEIEREFYLVPATPDELAFAIWTKEGGLRSLEALKQDVIAGYIGKPYCVVAVGIGDELSCVPKNGCRTCGIPVWIGGTGDPEDILVCHCAHS
jgi:hypothetical protein